MVDNGMHRLRCCRMDIKQLIEVYERENEIAKEKAAKCAREGKKQSALTYIRLKKLREIQIQKLREQLVTVEEQISLHEQTRINVEVYNSIESSTNMLKKFNEEVSPEKVEALMDDAREAIEETNEVSQALSEALSREGEDDAEDEYERMRRELGEVEEEPLRPPVPVQADEDADEAEEESDEEFAQIAVPC